MCAHEIKRGVRPILKKQASHLRLAFFFGLYPWHIYGVFWIQRRALFALLRTISWHCQRFLVFPQKTLTKAKKGFKIKEIKVTYLHKNPLLVLLKLRAVDTPCNSVPKEIFSLMYA